MPLSAGLRIVVTQGAYYSLIRVGWFRHVADDVYELVGARVMVRAGSWQLPGYGDLATAAAEGPSTKWNLLSASQEPEEVLQERIVRPIRCDERAWAQHCPKPKDWP